MKRQPWWWFRTISFHCHWKRRTECQTGSPTLDRVLTALVVVPDYQLSLAIGKEGQNARLAARLTGFKIDIKSETQARESGDFYDYEDEEEYEDDEYGMYGEDPESAVETEAEDAYQDPYGESDVEGEEDGQGSQDEE